MPLDTAELVRRITAKHDCLTLLRDLGLRQRELIEAGEMTRLLEALAEKQRMIVCLQQAEQALDPFRNDDPAARAWSGEAERLHCAALVRRCETMFAEILNCEKHCEEALRRRRDETAEQLTAVQSAGAAHGAYAAAELRTTSTLDLSADF